MNTAIVFLVAQMAASVICILLLLQLKRKVRRMSQATDDLQAAIAAQGTVVTSAVELINGLPALVAEAVRKALEAEDVEDTAVEQAVAQARTDIEAQTQSLKDALVANTPDA